MSVLCTCRIKNRNKLIKQIKEYEDRYLNIFFHCKCFAVNAEYHNSNNAN